MKNYIRILTALWIVLAGLIFTMACTRTNNCNFTQTGYFIYLNTPKKTNNNIVIRAYFIPDQIHLNIDSISDVLIVSSMENLYFNNLIYCIHGHIPSKFRQKPNIPTRVSCDLKCFHQIQNISSVNPTTIVCIENL